MSVAVHHGDCRTIIPALEVTVDSVVCDPPYDLVAMTKRFGNGQAAAKSPDHQRFARGFMGQQWDGEGVAFDPETWRTIGSVLRPGGFLVAFGAPRTHHRMACAIEDAGFVIQDCLMWLFGTGFPKRRDALKPAYEPLVLAYKPGGARTMQVDECRIKGTWSTWKRKDGSIAEGGTMPFSDHEHIRKPEHQNGRWPANIALSWPEDEYELRPGVTDEQKRELYRWLSENP